MNVDIKPYATVVSVKQNSVNVSINDPAMSIDLIHKHVDANVKAKSVSTGFGYQVIRDYVERDPYEGQYVIEPSDEIQTFQTNGKRMTADIVVEKIPSNYGKITYNGAVLTVS